MQRVCFRLQVRPERRDEYMRRHRAVWPEMLAALHATGWRNYSLLDEIFNLAEQLGALEQHGPGAAGTAGRQPQDG